MQEFLMAGAGVAALLAGAAFVVHKVRNAPVAFQGQGGFQYGEPTLDDLLPPGAMLAGATGGEFVTSPFLPKLSDDQRAVLLEMSEELGFCATTIATRTGLSAKNVGATRIDLRMMGLAQYGPLFNDDGRLMGTGYTLTEEGARVQALLRNDQKFREYRDARQALHDTANPIDPDPRIASHMAMGLDRHQAARNVEALDRALDRARA